MFDNAKKFLLLFFVSLVSTVLANQIFPWVVIGGGLAGITSIPILKENGVDEKNILWIDPEFNAGRLGKFYGNVPSNQKAYRFTKYLTSCSLFRSLKSSAIDAIKKYDQQREPPLQFLVNALQDITDYLRPQVIAYTGNVISLTWEKNVWRIELGHTFFYAHKVILATGSYPKRMSYAIQEIPLDLALDENKLKKLVNANDTVLVIGGAHSALLVLKYLSEIPVKKAINIYTKQPTFGASGGLEGITAWWTKEVLQKNPPANVERILAGQGVIEDSIKEANKIIYAFGYERNPIMVNGSTDITYDNATGIIQPNLYGIGIAFPELHRTKKDITISLVGVNSFMERAQKLIPKWMKES